MIGLSSERPLGARSAYSFSKTFLCILFLHRNFFKTQEKQNKHRFQSSAYSEVRYNPQIRTADMLESKLLLSLESAILSECSANPFVILIGACLNFGVRMFEEKSIT